MKRFLSLLSRLWARRRPAAARPGARAVSRMDTRGGRRVSWQGRTEPAGALSRFWEAVDRVRGRAPRRPPSQTTQPPAPSSGRPGDSPGGEFVGATYAPAGAGTTSGRPTYAYVYGALTRVARDESFRLLLQFYQNVPALKRAIGVLTAFVGEPEFVCATEAATAELNGWAANVEYGFVGRGLGAWLRDHMGQALLYGFGPCEAQTNVARTDILRLWSYVALFFGFRTDPTGALQIIQQQSVGGLRVLDPTTVFITVHDSQGCNPNGESLFVALPTVGQLWLDILHNFRQTWRRSGTPTFHVNWEPPENFDDPEGEIAEKVRGVLTTAWTDCMSSQVLDGKAKDYITTGKITVTVIGADGQVLDIDVSKRVVVEEIVVATDVPAWMLGYTWSSTERLSSEQAQALTARVEGIRREVEGTVRKITDLRQRLTGSRQPYEIVWPAINLTDLTEKARAALMESQARESQMRVERQLWADGVSDQAQYSLALTGNPQIYAPLDGPAAPVNSSAGSGSGASVSGDGEVGGDNVARSMPEWMLRELLDAYPEKTWKRNGKVPCGGKR